MTRHYHSDPVVTGACLDCGGAIHESTHEPRCKRCQGIRDATGYRWPTDGQRGAPTLDIQEGNWEEWH